MSSKLKRITAKTAKGWSAEREAKIWDYENGCWVHLTEEEIEKRWPKKEAIDARRTETPKPTGKVPSVPKDVQAFYAAAARRIRGQS